MNQNMQKNVVKLFNTNEDQFGQYMPLFLSWQSKLFQSNIVWNKLYVEFYS